MFFLYYEYGSKRRETYEAGLEQYVTMEEVDRRLDELRGKANWQNGTVTIVEGEEMPR